MQTDAVIVMLMAIAAFQSEMIVLLWMAIRDINHDMASVGRMLGRMMSILEFHQGKILKGNVIPFRPRA